jgi:hypothetical protein
LLVINKVEVRGVESSSGDNASVDNERVTNGRGEITRLSHAFL